MNVREELLKNQDLKYRAFNAKLIPNMDIESTIGVRIPILREIAKRAVKENACFEVKYYEEKLIYGMTIGYSKLSISEYISRLKNFVPMIDNWSICDSVCSTLKFTKKYQAQMLDYIKSYQDGTEYEVRFLLVMLMDYYLTDDYIVETLNIVSNIKRDEYYIKMAQAWLIATALAKYYDKTVTLIDNNTFNPWVHNKAIQKARESYRISPEQKEYLSELKR